MKGANSTVGRGAVVDHIALFQDNSTQTEGRIEDQRIVIRSEFVKKRWVVGRPRF